MLQSVQAAIFRMEQPLANKWPYWLETTGFQLNITPQKPRKTKTYNPQLTPQQKQENKEKASIRVKIEHAFGSVKIMRIVKEENRNYKLGYRDLVMKTAVALHNFRIMKRHKIESI